MQTRLLVILAAFDVPSSLPPPQPPGTKKGENAGRGREENM